MINAISVTCSARKDVPELEILWRDLETRSTCSFFLTWPWIGSWLEQLPPEMDVRILQARSGNELIGIAALVKTRRKIGGVPICEAWYLHASGDPAYDKLCIEHNDFLVDKNRSEEIRSAMVNGWASVSGHAAELHLPGLPGSGFASALAGDMHREDETKVSAGVALGAVRDAKLDFTPLLSSHARRFVRRSIKEYQTIGNLVVEEASSAQNAHEYLAGLIRLHEAIWQKRGLSGAFTGPGILAFHHRLIDLAWPDGTVQLLRVRAGEAVLGYLYGFERAGKIYVYQSGFDYALLEKHGRPGLVTHTLAIQHYAGRGSEYYDLLAGESQYKATVSTVNESMTWSVWRKPAFRFTAERLGRQAVRRLRQFAKQREKAATSQETVD